MYMPGIQDEILHRAAQVWSGNNALTVEEVRFELDWIETLEQVTTEEAFKLAEDGKEVYAIYDDGTDSLLDDLETEREYYKDLSLTYPHIPTIFVIEKNKEE